MNTCVGGIIAYGPIESLAVFYYYYRIHNAGGNLSPASVKALYGKAA